MKRRVSNVLAGWRTGLSRPVLILQAGNALNYFGYGLVTPFEIIYLHQIRGFPTSTAGLVLAATMGTAAIVIPPTGALLDRYPAKAILVAGSLASALGYAGFAYVELPWQAFVCSIVSGAGIGAAGTANRTLTIRLVKREERAAAFALNRVAGNFGIGTGAAAAGFIVASAQRLGSFQTLYFFDAVTYALFALIVLFAVPSPRAEAVTATDANGAGYRAVARDRVFLTVIAANIVLVVVGHTLFSNILPPFAKAHTPVGPAAIGIIVLVNTLFVVIAQIPAVRVVARLRRTHAFAATSALFAISLLAVLPATLIHSELAAAGLLAGVAIVFAIGEISHILVLGPLVADMAPAHLLGRYLSLYQLTFAISLAVGPAIGGFLLQTSPDAIWWGGALAAMLAGAVLLRLGARIPDPLRQAESRPGSAPEPATAAFSLDEAVLLLERTPRVVRELTDGLPESWLRGLDTAGGWTTRDVVGHLISAELDDWIPRAEIILREGTNRPFDSFDRLAHEARDRGVPLASLVDRFAELRGTNLARLRDLVASDSDLERRGRHPELGEVTLGQLLATWAVHDLDHLGQIHAALAGSQDSAVGPWKAYLGILLRRDTAALSP